LEKERNMAKKATSLEKKKVKKLESVKCEKCGLEFPESTMSEEHKNKAFVWDDKILCEGCLVMMGGYPGTAQVWEPLHNDQNKAKQHDW
jgi:Pyruvate/2-oxoacid:ferredoxin oxidoreductase delta subunit